MNQSDRLPRQLKTYPCKGMGCIGIFFNLCRVSPIFTDDSLPQKFNPRQKYQMASYSSLDLTMPII
ncbi:MAG: hypothetical protein F6K22_31925 [Okeania sp. SIO2F4]|uniref:hypothetical protein n=1 Tax=Okeania sp. SIO2F4 TaxID=2607790 RepID=UPI00142ADBE2|nr:hypothetical protein [Okeania sp. SIO2F4]NES07008.1 hypothetical protein [Okeania sp. SIO2F4]